ncbi:hypothetical protein [Bacillus cereus group sp. BfR-BA-01380]|uniref:hypothetical protein n=1 Tax=Bacillus cereus group sp. BfR-BA-01380 TaxID=2920324 RepID=UPI001F5A6767|nr:hypothetical protein [Bacillus cereus group sp. BfR-BA-01380]
MKKKKIFPVLLSLGLAFGVGVTTLAIPATNASAEIGNEQEPIILKGSNGSAGYDFNVPAGYGHVKMYFKNLGETAVTVYLKHESGKYYIEKKKIEPGERYDWISNTTYPQGVRGGKYDLSLTSGNKPTKVEFSFKASDNKW